jgi:hypothetical protein
MTPKVRGSIFWNLPQSIKNAVISNYLWTLSKGGKTHIDREEPEFSQGLATHPDISIITKKSLSLY